MSDAPRPINRTFVLVGPLDELMTQLSDLNVDLETRLGDIVTQLSDVSVDLVSRRRQRSGQPLA